ncbi:filaggrin-2-like [Pseudoliparis swirei]|uniref:filaggrin-2-like n=1 Tax=Pseudoliparis swirei TaxID=2059687 RepID=UPI0024BD76A4|nr:filaggrin-2-like [Pseudoliparis swirei]
MPTIHVNLNSYPNAGQRAPGDDSFPLNNASQQNGTRAGQSKPRMQSGPSNSGNMDAGYQGQPGLVPTGYTHSHRNISPQRNADTQTYRQEPEPHRRSDGNSWDLLRGTPAYPSGTPQRGRTSPDYTSDYTYDTTHPPIREVRTPNRSQPRPQGQTASRSRHDAPIADGRTRSRSADLPGPNARGVTQLEAERHAQREGGQRDIRGSSGGQTAPRPETTRDSNPRAPALGSQPVTRQGPAADSRALADPNHRPQAHMAQAPPQGPGQQTHPVTSGASQPRQGGAAPVQPSPAQLDPSHLTQAALTAHTERAHTFQNRKQQTRAALLHPGPQAPHAPAPPPVIPLAQFQALPRKQQHGSPTRGPQPPRPPVNIPVAQRPAHHHHQQHPGNGTHGHAHARGHGPPAHPEQHQTPRGRPR